MKNVLVIAFLAAIVLAPGCKSGPSYPPEFKEIAQKNELRLEEYLKRKDRTKKLDQKMLEANYSAWKKLRVTMEKGVDDGK